MITAAIAGKNWNLLATVTNPPETMEELTHAVEALCNLGRPEGARGLLDQHAERLEVPTNITADLRLRIKARKEIGR